MILLLTLAAYKLAVSTMIPQVSYQTALDSYVLANFLLLAAVALAVGVVPRPAAVVLAANDGGDDAGERANDLADTACFYLLFSLWCAIQLRYGTWAISLEVSRASAASKHEDALLHRQASATDRWGQSASYRKL